jgi:hypothetical protein
MTRGGSLLVAGLLACGAAVSVAAGQQRASEQPRSSGEQRKNFVSCPIVRDTASVPCWLAEYEGETYFLTVQSDVTSPVTPPWLGHRVLIEGAVSAEPRICGGIVLKPVHLSVLERDASCNTMLPAEERYNLTFEPPRPPGPSKGRLAFDNAPPAPPSPPVAAVREFTIPYDFDRMVGFNHAGLLTEVLNFARAVNAREIEIVGYRGAVRLSNGDTLVEETTIARKRAEQVAVLLQGANLKAPSYKVTWHDEPVPATGVDDHLARRVAVTVRP